MSSEAREFDMEKIKIDTKDESTRTLEEGAKICTESLRKLYGYKDIVLPYKSTKIFPDEKTNLITHLPRNKIIYNLIEPNDDKHDDIVSYIKKVADYINTHSFLYKYELNVSNIPELSKFSEPRDLDIYIAFIFALRFHRDTIATILKKTINSRLKEIYGVLEKNKMLLCFYKNTNMEDFLTGKTTYSIEFGEGDKTENLLNNTVLQMILIPQFLEENKSQIETNLNEISEIIKQEVIGGMKKATKRRNTRKSKKKRKNKRKKSVKRNGKSRR